MYQTNVIPYVDMNMKTNVFWLGVCFMYDHQTFEVHSRSAGCSKLKMVRRLLQQNFILFLTNKIYLDGGMGLEPRATEWRLGGHNH